jgi:hypothetical protein
MGRHRAGERAAAAGLGDRRSKRLPIFWPAVEAI